MNKKQIQMIIRAGFDSEQELDSFAEKNQELKAEILTAGCYEILENEI